MKKYKSVYLILITIIFISGSCISKKKLMYLQYADQTSVYETPEGAIASVIPSAYKIMPFDNLYIRVLTPDPQWSELFNAMPVGAGGAVTEESAALFGYPVDEEGNIEIPFVGKITAGGKTLAEIKTELDLVFKNYLTDASITVRLVNNFVSVLGEVNAPGRYLLTKDRVNVFEAISLAGDLSIFSNRRKVQLIRPSPYGPVVKEFSLADRNILSSELYYILPNDVIYVMPIQGRPFQTNSTVLTLFLSTISTALVIFSYIRTL
ncbi:MAG TPA: polysaccharide biosynthesis/export family protein [Bacteroidales bacterium]|jgi:polysaccharide export outer membrane protein|nr:polysaccharide biosynthesis/export family protein [Bacteroidales bacterium]HQK69998.1 polysaccharide biosynthesis/export family protein [Bacteroidales bacterium]